MKRKAGRRALVMDDIGRRITSRALVAGDKVPSIRSCAARLGISPSTVVEAYDLLVADGVIEARRGAGFFVADKPQPFAVAETGPQLEREVDPLWVARQSIDTGEEKQKPGCGWLPADWMPVSSLRKAMRSMSSARIDLLTNYGSAKGETGLRRFLSRRLHDQGLAADPDQVLLISGIEAPGGFACDLHEPPWQLFGDSGDNLAIPSGIETVQAGIITHVGMDASGTGGGTLTAGFDQFFNAHRQRRMGGLVPARTIGCNENFGQFDHL